MTHGPLSWRELVERDKQKSEDARNQIKRAAMQPPPRPQEAVMQSDIVQRLRQPWFTHGCAEYQHEAADEIERNRAEITRLTEALRAAEEEKKALREAVERLRSGYADAVSGYSYILTQHGRLEGVGFDRVMDHYHDWVAMPEREGLLAGSHTLAGAKP